jgi:hypothetical protein
LYSNDEIRKSSSVTRKRPTTEKLDIQKSDPKKEPKKVSKKESSADIRRQKNATPNPNTK